jgi:hypothetical protein
MFRNLLSAAALALACVLAGSNAVPADEFPRVTTEDIVGAMSSLNHQGLEWTVVQVWQFDQQFFNTMWMGGKFGPLLGSYAFPTSTRRATNPYLNDAWMAAYIPSWYWRHAVPAELRRDINLHCPGPISLRRPEPEVTPNWPTDPYGTYNYPYGPQYHYLDGYPIHYPHGYPYYVPHGNDAPGYYHGYQVPNGYDDHHLRELDPVR